MPTFFDILWDESPGGNVAHLAEHGVSPAEAAQVLRSHFGERQRSRAQPERWIVFGKTDAGRLLGIVFEYEADLDLVIPVTGFEPTKGD